MVYYPQRLRCCLQLYAYCLFPYRVLGVLMRVSESRNYIGSVQNCQARSKIQRESVSKKETVNRFVRLLYARPALLACVSCHCPYFPLSARFSHFAFSRVIWTLNYTTKILLLYYLFSILLGKVINIK